jgi:hypothetical protein
MLVRVVRLLQAKRDLQNTSVSNSLSHWAETLMISVLVGFMFGVKKYHPEPWSRFVAVLHIAEGVHAVVALLRLIATSAIAILTLQFLSRMRCHGDQSNGVVTGAGTSRGLSGYSCGYFGYFKRVDQPHSEELVFVGRNELAFALQATKRAGPQA